jgi:hypothetical protein
MSDGGTHRLSVLTLIGAILMILGVPVAGLSSHLHHRLRLRRPGLHQRRLPTAPSVRKTRHQLRLAIWRLVLLHPVQHHSSKLLWRSTATYIMAAFSR